MGAWLTYFKERFPILVYTLLVGGMAASGTRLAHATLFGLSFWISFIGLMLFFAVLRLMDELKDYEKDLVAHPERPLPRGLLKRDTVSRVINASVGAMFAFGFACYLVSPLAGGLYVLVTAYLWLMYKEFYVGSWLGKRPLLYAVTHQIILIPLCALPVAAGGGDVFGRGFLYGLVVLGSFFSYEVSRKLDAKANPILGYYRTLYGPTGCLAIVGVCSVLSVWAATYLGVVLVTLPFSALLIVSFLFLLKDKHQAVEGVASLSLLGHIWSVLVMGWL